MMSGEMNKRGRMPDPAGLKRERIFSLPSFFWGVRLDCEKRECSRRHTPRIRLLRRAVVHHLKQQRAGLQLSVPIKDGSSRFSNRREGRGRRKGAWRRHHATYRREGLPFQFIIAAPI